MSHRLLARLKQYYPQALALGGEDLWRPLATAFRLQWPSLPTVQKAQPATRKAFYYRHGSRRAKRRAERLALVAQAVAVTDETAGIGSFVLRGQRVCRQRQLGPRRGAEFDQPMAAAYAAHPDRELFASRPGAGPGFQPRLLASPGSPRERFPSAASLQHYTGIAPVPKRSGGRCYIHRRYGGPKFHRQSFHE